MIFAFGKLRFYLILFGIVSVLTGPTSMTGKIACAATNANSESVGADGWGASSSPGQEYSSWQVSGGHDIYSSGTATNLTDVVIDRGFNPYDNPAVSSSYINQQVKVEPNSAGWRSVPSGTTPGLNEYYTNPVKGWESGPIGMPSNRQSLPLNNIPANNVPSKNMPTELTPSDSPSNGLNRTGKTASVDYNRWQEHDVQQWKFQVMPTGLIYPSYLAGRKEPRLGCEFTKERDYGGLWDITLGGRAPLLRYGTTNAVLPEGWQLDMEGAALLRLDFERHRELAASDFRAGAPITYGTRHWQFKFAYYHVSSHLGDHYLLANLYPRVHYVRDELLLGTAWRPISSLRLYGEIGWAFNAGETTDPWEIQFGIEYSPLYSLENQKRGNPFAAIDVHLFQELNYGGYINCQTGWQWRSQTNSLFRLGIEYYNGCDDEFQFHYTYQQKFGFGIWYDF